MRLDDKFTTREEFLTYAEYVSGYDFDNEALMTWFDNNKDFLLSYTGIMQAIAPFVIGTRVKVKSPGAAD